MEDLHEGSGEKQCALSPVRWKLEAGKRPDTGRAISEEEQVSYGSIEFSGSVADLPAGDLLPGPFDAVGGKHHALVQGELQAGGYQVVDAGLGDNG